MKTIPAIWIGALILFSVAEAAGSDVYIPSPTPGGTTFSVNYGRTLYGIYFPPNPPPLGTIISGTGVSKLRWVPGTLSSYVGELFYPPISSRLFHSRTSQSHGMRRTEISGRQLEWLAEFDQLRFHLASELKSTLLLTREDDQESRQAKLAALAQNQADGLRRLETISEQLRSDLSRFGNWYTHREWKLGRGKLDKPREENGIFEFQVIRAAAFYQPGLSLPQRRLLREMAIEREETVLSDPGTAPLNEQLMFFQPETSRFLLPDNLLSEDLRSQIDEFKRAKDSLKKELSDALYELDGEWFASKREHGLEELAARQQNRMNELENCAEIIRQGFARIPGFIQSWVPPDPFPPQLQMKIEQFLMPAPVWEKGADPVPQVDVEALEREILDELEASETPVIGTNFRTFLVDRERKAAYFFYASALFQPGMSPAQRRLLYNDAIRNLYLILPGLEFQATVLPETLLN